MANQLTIEAIRQWCREARQAYPELREKIDRIERAALLRKINHNVSATGRYPKQPKVSDVYAQLNGSWDKAFDKCGK